MGDKNNMQNTFEEIFGKRHLHNKTCQACWNKTLPEILKKLEHWKAITHGLWVTDLLDKIPVDIKEKYSWQLDYKKETKK